MLKNQLLILCLLLATVLSAQRARYNFNAGWKMYTGDDAAAAQPSYNDSDWENVTLPRAWNEDEAFKKDIADLSTGIAWYRKQFRVPAGPSQKVFIEFEGVRQAAEVWVNGEYIGLHENGVMAFGFDITSFLKPGKTNTIAVRTDNNWDYKEKSTGTKFQWEDRNFNANYGGIVKNVFLHVTNRIYQTLPLYNNLKTQGVYVFASDFNIKDRKATIMAKSEIRNETNQPVTVDLSMQLYDRDGRLVAAIPGSRMTLAAESTDFLGAMGDVEGLHFWSWGYGYLYDVKTILTVNGKVVDAVITRTGFRKTEFKDGMIRLNDRVLQVHGYAQRTSNEWPAIGMSVPAWLSDYSNKQIIESNGNLVRWMHITPWKQDIESCDRVGLLQAMPAGDAEKDVEGVRWEQRKNVMRDAIIYNRNNPSIIFYECGNEDISETHMREMKAIRDSFDLYGGRAIGSREMLNSKEAEYGGEMLYINKSAGKPVWAMEYSRDEGLRKYWDDYSPPFHKDGDGPLYKGQPANEYNRNQESHAIENVIRWHEYWKERPGTGKRVSSGGVNIVFSETNTHHRGAENYRRSGEVDALRIRKENYYSHQVMWNGWVDPEKQGIHIIGHWNYTDSTTKTIYVVSTAEKVELFVNNRSLGFGKQQYRFLFSFPAVHWEKGSVKAVGYDKDGKIVCEQTKKTSGTATALRLTAIQNPSGFKADGQDLALIEVEAVDSKGQRCPLNMDTVHFTLNGAAEWRGGMAQGPDNFILATSLPLECGVNRVLIRSTTKAGKITLSASATGLRTASVSLQTKPVTTQFGLSLQLPSAGLKSNLSRGPTPATESFIATRTALNIIAAKAGSNDSLTTTSYDGNELSDWYSDGRLENAWIEYTLDKPALINEVNLKLNNFRTKIYPLRILVDGKEVFNGLSEKSLGYFLAVCKPSTGSVVRIELNKQTAVAGEKGTEVSGKKLDDGVTRDDAKQQTRLSIIEAEIYTTINQ